jgi:hypothetical protein
MPPNSTYKIAPTNNRLQKNMYGGGYSEVMDYGAIDAFPNLGYGTAAGMQDDDILVQKMADVMQNQFGLNPKMQGPAYTPPFPEWYYRVILLPRVKPPTEFTKFSGQDNTSTVEHIARYLMQLEEASGIQGQIFSFIINRPDISMVDFFASSVNRHMERFRAKVPCPLL